MQHPAIQPWLIAILAILISSYTILTSWRYAIADGQSNKVILTNATSVLTFYNLTLDHYEYHQKHLLDDTIKPNDLLRLIHPIRLCVSGLPSLSPNTSATLASFYAVDHLYSGLRDLQIASRSAMAYQKLLISTSADILQEYDEYLDPILKNQKTMNSTALELYILRTEPFLYSDLSLVANQYIAHVGLIDRDLRYTVASALKTVAILKERIDELKQLYQDVQQSVLIASTDRPLEKANDHRDTFKLGGKFFANVMQGLGLEIQDESIRSVKTFDSRYTACRKELKEYIEAALTLQALNVPVPLRGFEAILDEDNSIVLMISKQLGLKRHHWSWSEYVKANLWRWYRAW